MKNPSNDPIFNALLFLTTILVLWKSSHVVATDIVAPGAAQRNPGIVESQEFTVRGSELKKEIWMGSDGRREKMES